MMKKIALLLACTLFILPCLTACGKPAEEKTTGMPNPMVSVEGAKDFEGIGLVLNAPEGAADIKYYIIDKTLAHIDFKLADKNYIYRCAKTTDDITGVYDEFKAEPISQKVQVGENTAEITIKTTADSARLATWVWGDISYSLFARDGMTDDEIKALSKTLAESDCPIK